MKTKSLKSSLIITLSVTLFVVSIFLSCYVFLKKSVIKPVEAQAPVNFSTSINSRINNGDPFNSADFNNDLTNFEAIITNSENIKLTHSNQQVIVSNLGEQENSAKLVLTLTTASNASVSVKVNNNALDASNINSNNSTSVVSIPLNTEENLTIELTINSSVYEFNLNVLSRENYSLPTFTNGQVYSITQTQNTQGYVDKLVYVFDGNLSNFLDSTSNNPTPFITIPSNLTLTSATYLAPNATISQNINNQGATFDVNNFGTYNFTLQYNNLNNRFVELKVYSFGAKNFYRSEQTINGSISPLDKEFTQTQTSTFNAQTSRVNLPVLNINENNQLVSNNTSITLPNFARTNQVPVWFNYYASNYTTTVFYKAIGSTIWEQIANTSRFSGSGQYIVQISGYAPSGMLELDNVTFLNSFAFEITSSNPILNFIATSTYKSYDNSETGSTESYNLSSNNDGDSYTNGDVVISSEQQNSPFEKPYKISYEKVMFDENGEQIGSVEKIENYNGERLTTEPNTYSKYKVIVYFGTQQSYVAGSFTIDKTQVKIIPYFGTSSDKNNTNSHLGYTQNSSESFGLISSDSLFRLNSLKKASGASVNASMRYYSFEEVSSLGLESFNKNNLNYVLAKYRNSGITDFKPYAIGSVDNNGLLTSNVMGAALSAPGLYEFEILDNAYNTSFYYVFLDNFTPNVIYKTEGTNNDLKHIINFGDYKALELNSNVELKRTNVVVNKNNEPNKLSNILVLNNGTSYLTTKIKTQEQDINGWFNTQQLRKASSNSSGPITTNGQYRTITSNTITIYHNIKSNEGTYSYGVTDENENISNQGNFSISFDLADMEIIAKSRNLSTNDFFNNTLPNLTKANEVVGTNYNEIQIASAKLNQTDTTKPAFTLQNVNVEFFEKNKELNNDAAKYFASTSKNTNLFESNILNTTLSFSQEGKYVFTWEVNITGTNPTDAEGNFLYDTTRTQYIILDKAEMFEYNNLAKLTFQSNSNYGQELELKNNSKVNSISNGKVLTTNNTVIDSNLTPIRIENVGFKAGGKNYRVNPAWLTNIDANKEINDAIFELFEINKTITASLNGQPFTDFGKVSDAYVNEGKYNVVLSDNFNNTITFNTGTPSRGVGVNFNFNINKLSPSANFINTDIDNENIENNILSLNTLDANDLAIYDVTNINDAIASVKTGKTVNFVFDKKVVYTPSITGKNGKTDAQFSPDSYPKNAEIDLTQIQIYYNNQNVTPTISIKEMEVGNKSRVYLEGLDTSIERKIDIVLSYKGDYLDFGIDEIDENILTKTYTLYVDNTAPESNLNSLQEQDEFYQNIKDKNLNLENYFYGITSDYSFKKSNGDTPYLDTYKIFYRDIQVPIANKDNSLKTISPDDNLSETSNAPVFNENLTTIYHAFNYNTPVNQLPLLKNTIYEIVELDLAGNLESYFVCLKDSSQGSQLTISVQNYLNSQNTNTLTTYSDTVSLEKNKTVIPTFYNVVDNFEITNLSTLDSYFEYQVFDVTHVDYTQNVNESLEELYPLCENTLIITSQATKLNEALSQVITSWRNVGSRKQNGHVLKVKILDRLKGGFITFKISYRPNQLFNFNGIEPNGSILSTANENGITITITNPTFNNSYGYSEIGFMNLNNINSYQTILGTSKAATSFNVPREQSQNFKLEAKDLYGEVITRYFSSVNDYATFNSTTNASVNVTKTNNENAVNEMLTKLNLDSLNFYSDDLTFNYHTTFRDSDNIKVEVCENPLTTSQALSFEEVNLETYSRLSYDYTNVAIDAKNGTIYLPRKANAFNIYKITTKFAFEERSEVTYAAYYTMLPELIVTDSYQDRLYWHGDDNNVLRAIYANVNFEINEINSILNSEVLISEVNTYVDGSVSVPTTPTRIDNSVSLRVYGTEYIKRVFTFIVRNNLNNSKTFYITIDASSYPIYQFEKSGEILLESSINFNATIEKDGFDINVVGSQYFTNNKNSTHLILAEDKPSLTAKVVQGLDPKTNTVVGDQGGDFTIYNIVSNDPTFVHDEYVKITYVAQTDTLENLFNGASEISVLTTANKSVLITFNERGQMVNGNYTGRDYYVEVYVNNALVTINRTGNFTLSDAGTYNLVYKDIAGNTHTFNKNSSSLAQTNMQTINLLNKILFNVEASNYEKGELIDSMALENDVHLSVDNLSLYTNLQLSATYNGKEFELNAFTTLTKAGVYEITATANVLSTVVTSTYKIYLVKPNEQRLGLEFVINNLLNTTSNVTRVTRRDANNSSSIGSDVTSIFRSREGILDSNAPLVRLRMSPYESGNGLYTVWVETNYQSIYKPKKAYNFKVLILNNDPIINSNVAFGSSVSKNITLSWTPSELFENYGEINIKIGDEYYSITENDRYNNNLTKVNITKKGTYNIDIETPSGMILARYTLTKNDPINTVGIILIVLGVVALVVGILLFFKLRTKMKVK